MFVEESDQVQLMAREREREPALNVGEITLNLID